MTIRRFVFNPPAAQLFSDGETTRHLASNEPTLILEELPDPEQLHQRHSAQLSAMGELALPRDSAAPNPLFGDDLSTAYHAYRVRRLWVDDSHEREHPGQFGAPIGNAPPRALAAGPLATARLEALLNEPRDAGGQDERFYLFNVIVALEWLPSPERLRRLQWAFRRASDYLYDVTNGTMAIGQVIFADSAWMPCADIQILASNRYLPRSWVGGLFEPHKYTPIRLGRGLWVRDRRVVVDWDEPEGYRAIVHEWAHYALGMKDEYLRGRTVYDHGAGLLGEQAAVGAAYKVVLPERRVKSESIMASPQGNSELGNPLPIASEIMREVINRRYPGLQERLGRAWSGPGQLPLPLPHFRLAGALASDSYSHNERAIAIPFGPQSLVDSAEGTPAPLITLDSDLIPTGRREVFLVRYDEHGEPRRVSAQGELDARAPEQGFTLLGAAPGDSVVLLDSDGQRFQIWRRTLGAAGDGDLIARQWRLLAALVAPPAQGAPAYAPAPLDALGQLFAEAGWQREALPNPLSAGQTLAVVPLRPDDDHKNRALIRLSPGAPGAAVFGVDGLRAAPDARGFDLPSLDGYVVPASADGGPRSAAQTTLLVSDFSQGGPPKSAPSLVSDPIAAGAASGEALIMCDVTDDRVDTTGYRVISTTSRGLAMPAGLVALSPVYTIASNLRLRESFAPTLLIVNLQSGPSSPEPIRICLLHDDDTYTALPTYLALNAAYGAAPLTAKSVAALVSDATERDPGPQGEFIGRFVLARVPQAALTGAGGYAQGS